MCPYSYEEVDIQLNEDATEMWVTCPRHGCEMPQQEDGLYYCRVCELETAPRKKRVDPDDWDKDDPYERSHSGVGLVQTDKGDRYV